jgi:DnaK suppressor protein
MGGGLHGHGSAAVPLGIAAAREALRRGKQTMDTAEARERLMAERARLLEIIEGSEGSGDFGEAEQEMASDVLSYSTQPADAAQETFERERDFSVRAVAEAELREVDHALAKLEDGTYGVSEASGKPIPDDRLRARPQARFLVEEQEHEERRAGVPRGEGDPTATSGGGRLER